MVRAGELGLPMMLAIIGGLPERFAPLTQLYWQTARRHGHASQLGIASHGFLTATAQEAMNTAFPAYKLVMDRIGRERGWPPMTREQFDFSCTLRGANFISTPAQGVEKILFQHELFGHN